MGSMPWVRILKSRRRSDEGEGLWRRERGEAGATAEQGAGEAGEWAVKGNGGRLGEDACILTGGLDGAGCEEAETV